MTTGKGSDDDLTVRLTAAASIVQAFVCNNTLRAAELPALIETVFAAVEAAGGKREAAREAAPVPAVPIKKSVFPDYLICLEDGRKFRSLKRHLGTVYKMTPDEYRARWHLPHDYPMVAPNYSAVRSKLAREIGLGRSSQTSRPVEITAADPPKAPRRPGRRT